MTRRKVVVLIAGCGVLAVAGLCTYAVQGMLALSRAWQAVDYNEELGADDLVLSRIAAELGYESMPSSARDPRMYRAAGRDATYWVAFSMGPDDMKGLEEDLRTSGCERSQSRQQVRA